MRIILSLLSFLVFAGFANAEEDAHASAQTNTRVQQVETPNKIGGDGAFGYSVPIDLPAFRGLVPNIRLQYNSQNKSRSGSEAIIAQGWSLAGLSSIELKSPGGGAPTYDPKLDVYFLDGVELLACEGNGATNEWAWDYPDAYRTNNNSASCEAGGNMVLLRDNFQKVLRAGGPTSHSAYFYVYRQDGTRLTYQNLGTVLGESTGVTGEKFEAAFRRKWVLVQITDLQSQSNVVTISYEIEGSGKGYAYRPKSISYVGYLAEFHYEASTQPASGFATGTQYWGLQDQRLKSITVKDGTSPLRAYRLDYSSSALSKTNLLSKVRVYGSDFVQSGSNISGGSQLPDHSFWYAADAFSHNNRTYANEDFHTSLAVADLSSTGRDELLFYQYKEEYGSSTIFTLPTQKYSFDASRNIAATSDPHLPNMSQSVSTQTGGIESIAPLGFSKRDTTTDKFYAITLKNGSRFSSAELRSYAVGDSAGTTLSTINFSAYSEWLCDRDNDDDHDYEYHAFFSLGNFDTDPESELIAADRVYDINDGNIVINNGLQGDLADEFCREGSFQTGDKTAVADIDGDGLDEIIGTNAMLDVRNGVFKKVSITNSPFSGAAGDTDDLVVRFGDVNGDGAADAVIQDRAGSDDRLGVSLSTGSGFLPVDWGWEHANMPNTTGSGGPRNSVVDVNGDGLADLLVHNGYSASSTNAGYLAVPLDPYEVYVFLSDGQKFFQQTKLSDYLGAGDFDGDGLIDIVRDPSIAAISFGNGGIPHLMTSVKDNLGATTTVEYSPSTAFSNNDIPGVQQLVTRIVRDNGFAGQERETRYSYVNGAYDYRYRKSLGYQTVTAFLPMIPGETESPELVTTYVQDHWGLKGRVKSSTLLYAGTTQQQTIYDYETTLETSLPLRSKTSKETNKKLWGGRLIETITEFSRNVYNQPTRITEYGFGGTGAAADDLTTIYGYENNLSKFIVNKPYWKLTGNGSSVSSSDRSNWVRGEYYTYDGNGYGVAPTYGNLTKLEEWKGEDNHNRRIARSYGYDGRSNLLWVENGRGNRTTYEYEGSKQLLLKSTTNARGHKASSTWHYGCQKPLTETNINGFVTSYTYDVFCRETQSTKGPNNYTVNTAYQSFGSPTEKHVRIRSDSSSSDGGRVESRNYINGFGEVYKSTSSGRRDLIDDASVILRGFDGRGNLEWESIPVSWATSSSNTVGSSSKTTFTYDPLGRLVEQINPDASKRTHEYLFNEFTDLEGQFTSFPSIQTKDEHCFDASSENTICGRTREILDSQNNTIRRYIYDYEYQDTDSASTINRLWLYTYDNLSRLVEIRDPNSVTWYYSYDSYGNRISATDPALGTWSMAYDANSNLTLQTDAKGQTIEFVYDNLDRSTKKTVRSGAEKLETKYYYDGARSGYYNTGQLTGLWISTETEANYHGIRYDYNNMGLLAREQHLLPGKTYALKQEYYPTGLLRDLTYQATPGSTAAVWTPDFTYDVAGRLTGFGSYIAGAEYNLRNQPTKTTFASGVYNEFKYNSSRGWLDKVTYRKSDGSALNYVTYLRTATGRVQEQQASSGRDWVDYEYDYAGRLIDVSNNQSQADYNQSFSYDRSGSMRSNSHVGGYNYDAKKFAPKSITFSVDGATRNFSYDANGNMTLIPAYVGNSYKPKDITYDGENRPVEVTFNGQTTRYVYGADGARLQVIENAGTANESITTTFGIMEIRNYGEGSNETMIAYPHSDVRIVNGTASYLHRDQLQSVRLVTNGSGGKDQRTIYRPFGLPEIQEQNLAAMEEDHGWIGERYDDSVGLQYLNARYYDPQIGIYIPAE